MKCKMEEAQKRAEAAENQVTRLKLRIKTLQNYVVKADMIINLQHNSYRSRLNFLTVISNRVTVSSSYEKYSL